MAKGYNCDRTVWAPQSNDGTLQHIPILDVRDTPSRAIGNTRTSIKGYTITKLSNGDVVACFANPTIYKLIGSQKTLVSIDEIRDRIRRVAPKDMGGDGEPEQAEDEIIFKAYFEIQNMLKLESETLRQNGEKNEIGKDFKISPDGKTIKFNNPIVISYLGSDTISSKELGVILHSLSIRYTNISETELQIYDVIFTAFFQAANKQVSSDKNWPKDDITGQNGRTTTGHQDTHGQIVPTNRYSSEGHRQP